MRGLAEVMERGLAKGELMMRGLLLQLAGGWLAGVSLECLVSG